MLYHEYYEEAVRLGWFDTCFYLDSLFAHGLFAAGNGVSLFEHFTTDGWRLGLSPCVRFSVPKYLARYEDVKESQLDPLYHYLVRGRREHRQPLPVFEASDEVQLIGLLQGPPAGDSGRGSDNSSALAHWGGGQQPSVPGRIGGVDTVDGIEMQVAVAQSNCIRAICIPYDWFRGREGLHDIDPTMAFCLLLDHGPPAQRGVRQPSRASALPDGSLEAQYQLIYQVLGVCSDPRYLRVHGKPLVVVNRPERLEDARLTFALWREVARRRGHGGLYVVAAPHRSGQSCGLDGIIEILPTAVPAPSSITPADVGEGIDGGHGTGPQGGQRRSSAMPVFPGFLPDRSLRRRPSNKNGSSEGIAPELFRNWLPSATERIRELVLGGLPRFVFSDVHNGWADGCREFLRGIPPASERTAVPLLRLRRFAEAIIVSNSLPVLFLCDGTPCIEQRLIQRLIGSLSEAADLTCYLVVDAGKLESDLLRCTTSLSLCELTESGCSRDEGLRFLAGLLRARADLLVVSGSLATADLLIPFATAGHRIISLLHGLAPGLDRDDWASAVGKITGHAHRVIAGSDSVRKQIGSVAAMAPGDIQSISPGVPKFVGPSKPFLNLRLPNARHLLVASGPLQHSAGPDLFIHTARHLLAEASTTDYLFVWISSGPSDDVALKWAQHDAEALGFSDRVSFVTASEEAETLIRSADVFLVTAREDPELLAVLEAISAGVPIVCFDNAGEVADLVSTGIGKIVSYLDCRAMAEAIQIYVRGCSERQSARRYADALARMRSWDRYVEQIRDCLLELGNEGKRVRLAGSTLGRQAIADDLCVVIPSFNHKHFIVEALDSILSQSLRPKEIRIIDDGSDDGSAALVQSLASDELGIYVKVRENKGAHFTINESIADTQCPLIAILNSDDRWHPLRIAALIGDLRGPSGADVVFSRLRFIGSDSRIAHKVRWYERGVADYKSGTPLWLSLMFCNFFFTTSNLVASREKLQEIGGLGPFRFCHDLDYILKAIFAGHKVKFVEQTLCEYRIHDSNTIDEDMQGLLFEEAWIVAKFLSQNAQRVSDADLRLAAQRSLDKGLAAMVLGILEVLSRDQIDYDYRTASYRPHDDMLASRISDYAAASIAEPRALAQEIGRLVGRPGNG